MNISEIAEMAGVSKAAVSRYLNDGYLSEEKRESIRKVIEKTGYVPSSQAQMLRTKKTKLIGVIVPKISSDTISRIVDGITEELSGKGYSIILGNADNNSDKETEFLNIMKNNAVDGIIFIASVLDREQQKVIDSMKIPIVIVGQQLANHCCIYHDNKNAAKALTDKLLASGKREVGYLGVNVADRSAGLERREGFLESCVQNGIGGEQIGMRECLFTIESGYEQMKSLLEEKPEVQAVFCATSNIAIGAMQYAKEIGKKVPEDISFVGIGSGPVTELVNPRLTCIHFYYRTSGLEAGKMILNMLETKRNITQELKLGYELIERESV